MEPTNTTLLTVTGRDKPGVSAALFGALSDVDVEVLDVEQVVIRGRLILGFLLTRPSDVSALEPVCQAAADLGLDTEIEQTVGDARHRAPGRAHVTVLGLPLRPAALSGLAGRIADLGGNIDRIVRIARYPVTAVELQVSGAEPDALRVELAAASKALDVDVAVQRSGLHRRAKRLVVMDVDSTLIQGEVVEMLAAHAGCEAEVARITEQAMRGELDFAQSLQARVALLKGLPESALKKVESEIELMPGARTLVRTLGRLGYRTAIVSGGFTQITDALAADLGIDDAAANTLEVADGQLTGRLVGDIVDRAGKATALRRFAEKAGVPVTQTVAIGDGANDLDMIAAAGLGIAFNAKPVVRDAADAAVNVPFLDAILYLLGITREEVEAADAEAGLETRTPPVR